MRTVSAESGRRSRNHLRTHPHADGTSTVRGASAGRRGSATDPGNAGRFHGQPHHVPGPGSCPRERAWTEVCQEWSGQRSAAGGWSGAGPVGVQGGLSGGRDVDGAAHGGCYRRGARAVPAWRDRGRGVAKVSARNSGVPARGRTARRAQGVQGSSSMGVSAAVRETGGVGDE